MPEEISDSELINKFIDGDESAFNRLILRYQQKIYWHARRMTGNHFDADDVLQEVLVILFKKLGSFQSSSSLYTWIYKITTNTSINYINRRKIKRFFSLSDDETPEIQNPEDFILDIENREKLRKLDETLKKLPTKQREVFIYRHYDELSYEEISQITGKTIGNLKANYFHALNKVLKYGGENGEKI